jgi:hypothetical protein
VIAAGDIGVIDELHHFVGTPEDIIAEGLSHVAVEIDPASHGK